MVKACLPARCTLQLHALQEKGVGRGTYTCTYSVRTLYMTMSNINISQVGGFRPSHQRVLLRGQLRIAMPKRPTEEQMERAVAAGDPPVSAKHPADEEWLAA